MTTYYVNSAVGSDSNAGTSPGSGNAWSTISHAIGAVAAGDLVYIEAIAGNSASYPTTGLDYTLTTYYTPAAGTVAAGWVQWVGRNGVPTIGVSGLAFYSAVRQKFVGLYFVATGNGGGNYGIISGDGALVVQNCTINTNNQGGLVGISMSGLITNCELTGGSGTITASSGADLIYPTGYGLTVEGCRIHKAPGRGVYTGTNNCPTLIKGCRIYKCKGNGIEVGSTSVDFPIVIRDCTIDANEGHGVAVTGTGGAMCCSMSNSIISNHTGSGKYGLTFTDGTSTLNDYRKRSFDYNNLYNNMGNYNNVTAGAHDLAVDPQYTDATNGDYTPGNSALQAGFP